MSDPESGHIVIGQNKVAYSIQRSVRRRRSIGLLVGREGEIRILVPARARLAAIERLLLRQTEWIGKRIESFNRRRKLHPVLRFEPGESIPYRGENFTLRIAECADKPQGCVIENDAIIVNLHNAGLSDALLREEIRLEIMLWYKKRAREVFRERVDVWSEIIGLHPRRLAIGNARRQWGSCSAGNDVRLNWRLITASPPLLDYVIVHELCHIAHKNHSGRFWGLVERFVPDWKVRRRELRGMDAGFGMEEE